MPLGNKKGIKTGMCFLGAALFRRGKTEKALRIINKVKSTGEQWIILTDHADTTVTILVYNPLDE